MRIFAVDPSLSYCGVAVLDGPRVIYTECIETHAPDSKRARFNWLAEQLHDAYRCASPGVFDVFAYEQFTGAQSSSAALSLAGSMGIVVGIAHSAGRADVMAFSPRAVKLAVAHADADKTEICERILELYPDVWLEKKRTRFTKQSEAIADAIAVAHCVRTGVKQVT